MGRSHPALPQHGARERFLPLWRRLTEGPLLRNLGGTVALQLALLVSGTLSARMLGPTNRGYVAILAILPSTVGQLGAVGISLATTYYLSSGQVSGDAILRLLRRPAAIQVATLTAVDSAIVLGYTFVSGAPILLAACITLLQLPATLAADYGIALSLGGLRHGLASSLRAAAPVLNALGLVYLFFFGARTLDAAVLVLSASSWVAGCVALRLGLRIAHSLSARETRIAALDPRDARREILRFGRRGYVGYLAPTDSFKIDQLAVGFLLSPRALGFYVVGAAFTTFTRILALNVGLSATPDVARHADHETRRAAIKRSLYLTAAIVSAVSLVIAGGVVVAIPLLFGKQYVSSILVAEWLLLASWFLAMKRIAVDLMRGAGELRIGTRAEIINLVAFVLLCVPGALTFGGVGVAGALAASAAAGFAYLVISMRGLGFI